MKLALIQEGYLVVVKSFWKIKLFVESLSISIEVEKPRMFKFLMVTAFAFDRRIPTDGGRTFPPVNSTNGSEDGGFWSKYSSKAEASGFCNVKPFD